MLEDRSDADARALGDACDGGSTCALRSQDLNSNLQHRLDERVGAGLLRWFCEEICGLAATYEPARLAITMGHLGLIVALFHAGVLRRAWPLRALGHMAPTTYSLQAILASIIFYGLGYLGALSFLPLTGIVVAIWCVTGLFCVLWLRGHAIGPAEWLLRAIVYRGFDRHRWGAAAVLATSSTL